MVSLYIATSPMSFTMNSSHGSSSSIVAEVLSLRLSTCGRHWMYVLSLRGFLQLSLDVSRDCDPFCTSVTVSEELS